MNLTDEFRDLVETTLLEVEDRRLSALSAKEWRVRIKNLIDDILTAAVDALIREAEIQCRKQGFNGSGSMLLVQPPNYSPAFGERDIRFSFPQEEGIQVTSTYPDLCTRLDRSHATKAALLSTVKEFVRRTVADYPEKPPDHELTVRGIRF